MATHSTVWTGILSTSASSLSVGYAVVRSGDLYLPATDANRTACGRAVGVAITAADSTNKAFEYQVAGVVPDSITGLGTGTASWVRVSSTGTLERCTPAAGDDLIGKCLATGDLLVSPGVWDSDNSSGGGPDFGSQNVVTNGAVIGGVAAMAALEVDWSLANAFTKTLAAGANAITMVNPRAGQVIVVRLTSNGAGSTVTWTYTVPSPIRWAGGVAPTQTSTGTDVYTFFFDGTRIYGSVVQDMP